MVYATELILKICTVFPVAASANFRLGETRSPGYIKQINALRARERECVYVCACVCARARKYDTICYTHTYM